MYQPTGFSNGNCDEVRRLLRSLYGLRQAPKNWRKRIEACLRKCGLIPLNADSCVFTGMVKGFWVILVLYVDDGLIASKSRVAILFLLSQLKSEFELEIKEPDVFVGIEIRRTKECMYLSQQQYILALLQKYGMTECKGASVPMQSGTHLPISNTPDLRIPYRELVGGLLFLSRVSRPDICYAVAKLAQYNHCYVKEHWLAAIQFYDTSARPLTWDYVTPLKTTLLSLSTRIVTMRVIATTGNQHLGLQPFSEKVLFHGTHPNKMWSHYHPVRQNTWQLDSELEKHFG